MRLTEHDDAALDNAVRGTIALERINGLVYAVVMESRGIYMSADWHAAEPFGKNLALRLTELQAVVQAWTADAIAAQESNVEETAERADLTDRIDQFVRFRTELLRLAREDSTAAARAFGDNEANRTAGPRSTTACVRSPVLTRRKLRERAARSKSTTIVYWRSC
jgi:methyl-accepting chemotaxis protein